MLHALFQGYLLTAFGEVFKAFTMYEHGGPICHVTWMACSCFLFPYPWRCMNLAAIGPVAFDETLQTAIL